MVVLMRMFHSIFHMPSQDLRPSKSGGRLQFSNSHRCTMYIYFRVPRTAYAIHCSIRTEECSYVESTVFDIGIGRSAHSEERVSALFAGASIWRMSTKISDAFPPGFHSWCRCGMQVWTEMGCRADCGMRARRTSTRAAASISYDYHEHSNGESESETSGWLYFLRIADSLFSIATCFCTYTAWRISL